MHCDEPSLRTNTDNWHSLAGGIFLVFPIRTQFSLRSRIHTYRFSTTGVRASGRELVQCGGELENQPAASTKQWRVLILSPFSNNSVAQKEQREIDVKGLREKFRGDVCVIIILKVL